MKRRNFFYISIVGLVTLIAKGYKSVFSADWPVTMNITQDCTSCGDCVDHNTCPYNAISEGSTKYVIDESLCDACRNYRLSPLKPTLCQQECYVPYCIVPIYDPS